jgi:hypothetical protein
MPTITPLPAGTFNGIPSHLNALFRSASWQQDRLAYSRVGNRFIEVVPDLVPDDFDEKASWEDLLNAELSPILLALASDAAPNPANLNYFKAWMCLRFPGIAAMIPSSRWAMFARGAAQASEEGWW